MEGDATATPRDASKALGGVTVAPSDATATPGDASKALGSVTVAPSDATATPGDASKALGSVTVAPSDTTATPGDPSAALGNVTVAPSGPVVTPSEAGGGGPDAGASSIGLLAGAAPDTATPPPASRPALQPGSVGPRAAPAPQGWTMSEIYSEVAGDEPPSDSFWMPNHYQRTVRRLEEGSQVCDQLVGCFRDRARIEGSYARHMGAWVQKWRPLVDASESPPPAARCPPPSPLPHPLPPAARCPPRAPCPTPPQHSAPHQAPYPTPPPAGHPLPSPPAPSSMHQLQPLVSPLPQVEKAKASYHRACRKEHAAAGREQLAPGGPPLAPDRQRALREERQRHTLETHKERQHYEQALAELTRANPRYMEEMESVFEQGQEFEQRRIEFLKEALTALQRRLDPTAHSGATEGPAPVQGQRVRAIYDYAGQEPDELSFTAGEELTKLEEQDPQGWCKGVTDGGRVGLYPANYVQPVP
ncbi:tiggy-winkle hedgehog protein [Platysternon megacephalum]|uniref:Tiggy-winkle hedgehog protein n=1 Tax=Platysternon megacephalum TaxID=55544 RepID=A0A4D9DM89_9SAUR|nr:tiggy-winkle hedgehog protein [Platysternon megacephalum]